MAEQTEETVFPRTILQKPYDLDAGIVLTLK